MFWPHCSRMHTLVTALSKTAWNKLAQILLMNIQWNSNSWMEENILILAKFFARYAKFLTATIMWLGKATDRTWLWFVVREDNLCLILGLKIILLPWHQRLYKFWHFLKLSAKRNDAACQLETDRFILNRLNPCTPFLLIRSLARSSNYSITQDISDDPVTPLISMEISSLDTVERLQLHAEFMLESIYCLSDRWIVSQRHYNFKCNLVSIKTQNTQSDGCA